MAHRRSIHSTRPCPGCGGTEHFRTATTVCTECEQAIRFYKKQRDLNESLEGSTAMYGFYMWAHWNKHMFLHGDVDDTPIQALFAELAALIGTPVASATWNVPLLYGSSNNGGGSGRSVVQLSPKVAEILTKLYDLISVVSEAGYKEGFDNGSNLLMRMAKGSLSEREFLTKTGALPEGDDD